MSDLRLLAPSLGSATLKAATYHLARSDHADAAHLSKPARIETPIQGGADQPFDALLQGLPTDGHVPDVVVHRIVHGGDLAHGCELDDVPLAQLDALAMLAPPHQPAAFALARETRMRWPAARHGVAFDTSFHATLAQLLAATRTVSTPTQPASVEPA
ncbi:MULTISPECIES: hypothetical protein [Rhodanobacter]|uniref:hypothetical protein n=1 Tax=Rhodanobacter TaxID=75309 RepID=UPI0004803093|nr:MULTISPECIES: hypothetical protein [Rhodanobacter]TAN15930.1 MAG: hypothetical protein EPN35_11975 [Rhodanobacter sp.]UJJ53533.1 hypothetical protein LRK53_11105 [Rhodanobacter thiooxydans]